MYVYGRLTLGQANEEFPTRTYDPKFARVGRRVTTSRDLANCLAADDLALCLSRLSAIARTSQAHELNKQSTGVVFSGLLTWMRSRGRSRSRAR